MCLVRFQIKQNYENHSYPYNGYDISSSLQTKYHDYQNAGKISVFAPCGTCEDCARSKQYAWAWRLCSDLQYYVRERAYKVGFVTLTYNERSLPRVPARYGNAAGLSCFSRTDTDKLILYLRKTLHRDYKCKEFLYFLASERGPNGTHRPHYHLIIAWNPACGLSARVLHERIAHYWAGEIYDKKTRTFRPPLGFITPKNLMGGERRRDGKRILPFEVESMDSLLKSAFYVAKYVTKDIYFMRDIKDKVSRDVLRTPEFKEFLPHHRQSKSLGFHGIASLSDAQKIDLLLRGKALLGGDKLFMPPLYIQNKLLFKPFYVISAPCKRYPDGKRYSFREATQFYKDYFGLIFDNKVKYYSSLFDRMKSVDYWLASGLSEKDSLDVSSFVNLNDWRSKFGCSVAEAYLCYYGMKYEYCFTDKRLTILNRYRFPAVNVNSSMLIDRTCWENIQAFFEYLLVYSSWERQSVHDEQADRVRAYFNMLA